MDDEPIVGDPFLVGYRPQREAARRARPNRHKTREERAQEHQPASDWKQGDRGEYKLNFASLDVEDIALKARG